MSRHPQKRTYIGIDQDEYGGMTPTGAIVKDAWIFGLIPETENCAGWDIGRMQMLYDKVSDLWGQYNYRVGELPPDIRDRHARIHNAAIEHARTLGWQPDQLVQEDEN